CVRPRHEAVRLVDLGARIKLVLSMAESRSVARSTALAVVAFIAALAIVVFFWAKAELDWGLVFLPILSLCGVAGFTFVLARRGR
ncbi:MAG: hypothetical protein ABI137_07225, partial [Antricoccus sp.]